MRNKYVIRVLTSSQIREIYALNLIEDFPPNELKPLDLIEMAMEQEKYACYGCFDGKKIAAYAFVAMVEKNVLLEFFSVEKSLRNQGLGSWFLQALIGGPLKESDCALLEVDDPDYAPDLSELEIRRQRLRFYLRNGLKDTGVRATANRAKYRILALPVGHMLAGQDALSMYISLYRAMPPEEAYAKKVQVEGVVKP